MVAAGVASPHPRMACLPPLFRATQKEAPERDVRGFECARGMLDEQAHSGRGNDEIQAAAKISGRGARGGSWPDLAPSLARLKFLAGLCQYGHHRCVAV
jgi:hypothetical protein